MGEGEIRCSPQRGRGALGAKVEVEMAGGASPMRGAMPPRKAAWSKGVPP